MLASSGSAGQNAFYILQPLNIPDPGLLKGSALQHSSCFCFLSSLVPGDGGWDRATSITGSLRVKSSRTLRLVSQGDLEEQQGLWRTQKILSAIGCLKKNVLSTLVSEQLIGRGLDNGGFYKGSQWESGF